MQSAIPDTEFYLSLGLAVSALIMLLLIGSMVVRYQNLRQDMRVIQQLDDEA
jgi:hypothetical protein